MSSMVYSGMIASNKNGLAGEMDLDIESIVRKAISLEAASVIKIDIYERAVDAIHRLCSATTGAIHEFEP